MALEKQGRLGAVIGALGCLGLMMGAQAVVAQVVVQNQTLAQSAAGKKERAKAPALQKESQSGISREALAYAKSAKKATPSSEQIEHAQLCSQRALAPSAGATKERLACELEALFGGAGFFAYQNARAQARVFAGNAFCQKNKWPENAGQDAQLKALVLEDQLICAKTLSERFALSLELAALLREQAPEFGIYAARETKARLLSKSGQMISANLALLSDAKASQQDKNKLGSEMKKHMRWIETGQKEGWLETKASVDASESGLFSARFAAWSLVDKNPEASAKEALSAAKNPTLSARRLFPLSLGLQAIASDAKIAAGRQRELLALASGKATTADLALLSVTSLPPRR